MTSIYARKNTSFRTGTGISTFEEEAAQRRDDARFVRALALAFKRGDHWPAAEVEALKRRFA